MRRLIATKSWIWPDPIFWVASLSRAQAGQPLGEFIGPEYAGVDPANGNALYYLNTTNTDGSLNRGTTSNINQATNVPIGNPNPTWTGGITNTLTYKGFDLTATLVGVFGNQIYDGAAPFYSTGFNNGPDNQTRLIRLDEMLLTRAEANLRAGTLVGATPLADVNAVRARAGLAALPSITLAAILKERRLELAFKGFRLGDLKRNQESTIDPLVTSPTSAAILWNSSRLVLPIPLREINANSNLVQNTGY
jgi:hypothetical protein